MSTMIDRLLNQITMYRLVLYYLIFLLGVALVESAIGILPYDVFALLFTTGFLVAVCGITSMIFARTFRVPANMESVYISALILALIITPLQSTHDLWYIGWTGVWAMASKYIIAINRKHLFNPVAFAVALTAFTLNQPATWWVGNLYMLPFVVVGGILIILKIRRFDLVASFLLTALATMLAFSVIANKSLAVVLQQGILESPTLFFAFVILTEPLTTPPTRHLQIIYGVLVGFLFAPDLHVGSLYLTPELAILAGNVYSYLVSPKAKLVLQLRKKIQIAPDVWDFIFVPDQKLAFEPGQYMEWTLGHYAPDSRGIRRYFTLASSPTEDHLRLGVKFYPNSSSYKQSMLEMDADTEIVAAQLAGDFTLPKDKKQKIVLIAGGIGITPYRSMIKFLLDWRERRPITLLYSNRTADEIVYKDLFDEAERQIGLKVVYNLTDKHQIPTFWKGKVGRINARMIREVVPDYQQCIFYISGSNVMVNDVQDVLTSMNVKSSHIKTDYFPGLA
jgi:ferredoxin-NADP reductase